MSDHAYAAHAGNEISHGADHGPGFYIKIWAVLLVLLMVSIIGPMFGNVWLTLLTAFGIALIKATMVGMYFMHLNIEQKYVWYLFYAMLLAMLLLFMGVAPDVMTSHGQNWTNEASARLIEHYKTAPAAEVHH